MSILVISVYLGWCCSKANIQKVLECLQEEFPIEKIEYDEKINKVIVRGKFDAQKLSKKIWCMAGNIVKEIKTVEVWPPPKPSEPVCKPFPLPLPFPFPVPWQCPPRQCPPRQCHCCPKPPPPLPEPCKCCKCKPRPPPCGCSKHESCGCGKPPNPPIWPPSCPPTWPQWCPPTWPPC